MTNNGRIDIEYPLTAKSPNIIWDLISSAHGLERWMADHVDEADGVFTFTWGEPWTEQDVHTAQLIEYVKYDHIRLKWDEDEDEDTYLEMRIEKSDLTANPAAAASVRNWPAMELAQVSEALPPLQ